MPAVFLDGCSRLQRVLCCLTNIPPHNWLISALECYDYCGWEGSEKWAKEVLFLSDEELRSDIESRDPQIIWGVFSAVPICISKEEAFARELPWLDGNPAYMRDHLYPQHPEAFLEIAICDSSYTYVVAHDAALLQPLFALPYPARDEELDNQRLNATLRRILTALKTVAPSVSDRVANEVQWFCWRKLFSASTSFVSEDTLVDCVREAYIKASAPGYLCKSSFWDPFHAD